MNRSTQNNPSHSTASCLYPAVMLLAMFVGVAFVSDGHSATSDGLKILVYGATGRVGSRVVNEALNRGHAVTAVSRDPTRIKQQHARLSAARGDILDRESVKGLVSDQDVIVVSVRGSVDDSNDPENTVQRMSADILVGVLRSMGDSAPRLIYVGGAGSLEIEPGVLYADDLPGLMPGFIRQEIQGHVLTLEFLRTVEDVRWTYISPAKKFKPGKRTGIYRIGGDQMLVDQKGKSKISMEDFAVALIDEAENSEHLRERFSVAY
jgi:putative NADH-flavin reductase